MIYHLFHLDLDLLSHNFLRCLRDLPRLRERLRLLRRLWDRCPLSRFLLRDLLLLLVRDRLLERELLRDLEDLFGLLDLLRFDFLGLLLLDFDLMRFNGLGLLDLDLLFFGDFDRDLLFDFFSLY